MKYKITWDINTYMYPIGRNERHEECYEFNSLEEVEKKAKEIITENCYFALVYINQENGVEKNTLTLEGEKSDKEIELATQEDYGEGLPYDAPRYDSREWPEYALQREKEIIEGRLNELKEWVDYEKNGDIIWK